MLDDEQHVALRSVGHRGPLVLTLSATPGVSQPIARRKCRTPVAAEATTGVRVFPRGQTFTVPTQISPVVGFFARPRIVSTPAALLTNRLTVNEPLGATVFAVPDAARSPL